MIGRQITSVMLRLREKPHEAAARRLQVAAVQNQLDVPTAAAAMTPAHRYPSCQFKNFCVIKEMY